MKDYVWSLLILCIGTGSLLFAQGSPELQPGENRGFEWVFRQRALPLGYIPSGAGWKALEQKKRMPAVRIHPLETSRGASRSAVQATGAWTLIGPQPLLATFPTAELPAGRTNDLGGSVWAFAVDPRNKNVAYMGGASGGVWKTTDGGLNWTSATD